jgi:copper homeostasis protein
MDILIEACVNSVESAVEAQRGGARRVELCENLFDGGTTPSAGAMHAARRRLTIGFNVMIRPRGGDFCYSLAELEIMKGDLEVAGAAGVDGVVFGMLDTDGTVDEGQCRDLIRLARPMSVTFHRAFDMTADPLAALDTLIDLGVDRVLTSGQQASAVRGADLIARLVERAGDRLVVMPGVGIDETNITGLIVRTGASEYHVLAEKRVASPVTHRNETAFMGSDPDRSEYERLVTDQDRIRAICEAAARGRP